MKIIVALSSLLLLAACSRQSQKPECTASDIFNTWCQEHFETNAPTCDTTTLLDGTLYFDVYGLTSSNLQDLLLLDLSSASPLPAKVTFWKSPTLLSLKVSIDNMSQNIIPSSEEIERDRQNKFLRQINTREQESRTKN